LRFALSAAALVDGQVYASKLADIIMDMHASDFRPQVLIWLLGQAVRLESDELVSVVSNKLMELSKTSPSPGLNWSEFLSNLAIKSVRLDKSTVQFCRIISGTLRNEPDLDWLDKVLNSASGVWNYSLVESVVEDEQVIVSLKPKTFLGVVYCALSFDDFSKVENLITRYPPRQKHAAFSLICEQQEGSLDMCIAPIWCFFVVQDSYLMIPSILALKQFSSVKEIEVTLSCLLNFATRENNEYFQRKLDNLRSKARSNKNRANLLLTTDRRGLQLINCLAIRSLMVVNLLMGSPFYFENNQVVDCVLAVLFNSLEKFLTGKAKPHQIFSFNTPGEGYGLDTLFDLGVQIHRNFMIPKAVWFAMEKYGVTHEELRAFDSGDIDQIVSRTRPDCYFFIFTIGDYVYLLRLNNALHRHREPIELRPLSYTSWPPLAEPVTIGNYKIVCLTDSVELIEEGKALKHCVGSGYYADLCSKGSSCIFSIRTLDDKPVATAQVKVMRDRLKAGGRIWELIQIRGYKDRTPDPIVLEVWNEFERQVFQGSIKILDTRSAEEVASSIREKFARGVSPLERFIGIPVDGNLDALTNEYRRVGIRDDNNVVHSFVPTEEDPHYDLFITTIDKMAQEIVKLARSAKARNVRRWC
ncbi:MAG: PcfJ domain-containing protein, partial [Deltaproteobacteria bacterium]|nr:PcfJ domain-containing protein [Deltaproteobacteria bacterium]